MIKKFLLAQKFYKLFLLVVIGLFFYCSAIGWSVFRGRNTEEWSADGSSGPHHRSHGPRYYGSGFSHK